MKKKTNKFPGFKAYAKKPMPEVETASLTTCGCILEKTINLKRGYAIECPLHAAAPELLKALKKLHEDYAHFGKGYWVGTGQSVEKLIAKAEGKS